MRMRGRRGLIIVLSPTSQLYNQRAPSSLLPSQTLPKDEVNIPVAFSNHLSPTIRKPHPPSHHFIARANMDAASWGLPPSFQRHIHSPRLKAERERARNAALAPVYPPPIHQGAGPNNGPYQQPQPYYRQQGGHPPQGYPQQGFPPRQGMYYQQQQNGPAQGYYANNGGRNGAEGGLFAALAASLACCCCLDVCIL